MRRVTTVEGLTSRVVAKKCSKFLTPLKARTCQTRRVLTSIYENTAPISRIMLASADSGGESNRIRRRLKKQISLASYEQHASEKTPNQILPLPLPILIFPLLLLMLCAIMVMLPPSILMSTSHAVQLLMSKASMMNHLVRVHSEANAT